MKKVKDNSNGSSIPAVEWIRQVGEETAAFDIARVVERQTRRADPRKLEWDQAITVSVKPDQRPVELFVLKRRHLLPNSVLGLLHKLQLNPPKGVVLLCAPYISPRVAEMCQTQNVSYLDSVGNSRIAAPGLFVNITGRPNQAPVSKTVDPFSTKSSRIVRAFLTHPGQGWQVQQLAQQADVSLGLVSKVKTTLLEEAYIEERQRLLFVRDPIKLLHAWSAQYRPNVKRVQLFAMPRPFETEKRLAEWCQENKFTYALTQLSAAWRYSPMVRFDKSVIYIDRKFETGDHLNSLLANIDAQVVETGANCTLWITEDSAVFHNAREFEGVKVVSPVQLYLDLKVLAGRGEDAAQELFERQLYPSLAKGHP